VKELFKNTIQTRALEVIVVPSISLLFVLCCIHLLSICLIQKLHLYNDFLLNKRYTVEPFNYTLADLHIFSNAYFLITLNEMEFAKISV